MAAADDFLRSIEDTSAANKSKRWLSEAATDKQKAHLRNFEVTVTFMDFSWTKYKAACVLSYYWNRDAIDRLIASKWKILTGEDR
jgi:DNA repair protein RadD